LIYFILYIFDIIIGYCIEIHTFRQVLADKFIRVFSVPLREKEKNGRSEPRPYSQKLKIVKIVKLKIFLYTFAKKEVDDER